VRHTAPIRRDRDGYCRGGGACSRQVRHRSSSMTYRRISDKGQAAASSMLRVGWARRSRPPVAPPCVHSCRTERALNSSRPLSGHGSAAATIPVRRAGVTPGTMGKSFDYTPRLDLAAPSNTRYGYKRLAGRPTRSPTLPTETRRRGRAEFRSLSTTTATLSGGTPLASSCSITPIALATALP
jgi:hypothetical protein